MERIYQTFHSAHIIRWKSSSLSPKLLMQGYKVHLIAYLDNFQYILQIWLSDYERLGETK